MVGTSIKTGVDKLVEIISEKKKISVDEAAKKLGVGKDVVQEWAEFLEEDGSVDIDYSLSKVWIIEKRITKNDVLSSAKEVASEKDALSRKIDVAISSLERDSSGFEDIKKQFQEMQRHVKAEIETVKTQLGELEKFDALRKNLDKDVTRQHQEYKTFVNDAEEKLKIESQKYEDLRGLIDKERKTVVQYVEKMEELKKLRNEYERTVSSLKESLKNIDKVMEEYRKRFDDSNKVISDYKSALDKLDADISQKKGALLTKRLEELKNNDIKLSKSILMMEHDIREKMGSLQSYGAVSDKIHSSVDGFFSRNITAEKLIAEIENDKTSLTKDLEAMKSKVEAFTLVTSNNGIKSQLRDIESQLKSYERKKSAIGLKIEKLLSLVKGK